MIKILYFPKILRKNFEKILIFLEMADFYFWTGIVAEQPGFERKKQTNRIWRQYTDVRFCLFVSFFQNRVVPQQYLSKSKSLPFQEKLIFFQNSFAEFLENIKFLSYTLFLSLILSSSMKMDLAKFCHFFPNSQKIENNLCSNMIPDISPWQYMITNVTLIKFGPLLNFLRKNFE